MIVLRFVWVFGIVVLWVGLLGFVPAASFLTARYRPRSIEAELPETERDLAEALAMAVPCHPWWWRDLAFADGLRALASEQPPGLVRRMIDRVVPPVVLDVVVPAVAVVLLVVVGAFHLPPGEPVAGYLLVTVTLGMAVLIPIGMVTAVQRGRRRRAASFVGDLRRAMRQAIPKALSDLERELAQRRQQITLLEMEHQALTSGNDELRQKHTEVILGLDPSTRAVIAAMFRPVLQQENRSVTRRGDKLNISLFIAGLVAAPFVQAAWSWFVDGRT